MRNQLVYLFYSFALLSFLIIGGCGAASSGATKTCSDFATCGGTAKACCTSSKCWYEYDGKRFDCNGQDCGDAAVDLANYACAEVAPDEAARIEAIANQIEN